MKVHSANTNIKAAPEKIWTILTNGPNYPKWDPWATRIEGNIVAGGKVTAYTKLSPDQAFPVKVTEFVPGRKMTWTGGIPVVFKGVRTYTLEPHGNGTTTFTIREAF